VAGVDNVAHRAQGPLTRQLLLPLLLLLRLLH
jgi:hypothetical protein